jgi:hypothetical protein
LEAITGKHQIPSTKSQTSTNTQNPNDPNEQRVLKFGNWNLGFVWDLDIGIWNLEIENL